MKTQIKEEIEKQIREEMGQEIVSRNLDMPISREGRNPIYSGQVNLTTYRICFPNEPEPYIIEGQLETILTMRPTEERKDLEFIYMATRDGKINPQTQDGKEAWAEVLNKLAICGDKTGRKIAEQAFCDVVGKGDIRGYLVVGATLVTLGQRRVPERVGDWYNKT